MGTPLPDPKISIGDLIGNRFVVKKKLGEGSCGMVYLMDDTKNKTRCAMKVEPHMKNKEEEVLKMEIYVLKKLQKSKHVCRFFDAGARNNYNYVVMSLLGKDVTDLRKKCKEKRMSAASCLRIGLQVIAGVQDMHEAGFIHRDIKPTNIATGAVNKHVIFVFDFGLSRQVFEMNATTGQMELRPPRNKVSFRGTVRYCSPNVHACKEQGRHDDLWSVLYTMVELVTATLPWKGTSRKEAEALKSSVKDEELVKGQPPSFAFLAAEVRQGEYRRTPLYKEIKEAMAKDIIALGVKMTDEFEWEKKKKSPSPAISPATSESATVKDTTSGVLPLQVTPKGSPPKGSQRDPPISSEDKVTEDEASHKVAEMESAHSRDSSHKKDSGSNYDDENTLDNAVD